MLTCCSSPCRKNLTLWGNADALITAVANANNNTIVVVNAVGPIIMEAWVENPNGAHLTVSFSGHALIPSPPHIVTAVVRALGR